MPVDRYPYELPPLPYAYDALEPYIDAETMHYHHDRHLKTYITNLNKTIASYERLHALPLEAILSNPRIIPREIRTDVMNNGGGVYNHIFFFGNMRAGHEDNLPCGSLGDAISDQFGSFQFFMSEFSRQALALFGSGYVWLTVGPRGNLCIMPTENQGSPITYGHYPMLAIDVWEHAYYLKRQNRRNEYVEAWWRVINWANAEGNYIECPYFKKRK